MTTTIYPTTHLLRKLGWGAIAILFLIPVVGKALSSEVNWTAFDFAVWGGMLAIAGLLGEGVLRAFRGGPALFAGILAIGAGFLLVWINLAVGFIGNESNPINQLYLALLAVVLVAATIARFRPATMMWLMVFCAVAQLAILLLGRQEMGFEWVATAVFCLVWLSAAALFRMASNR